MVKGKNPKWEIRMRDVGCVAVVMVLMAALVIIVINPEMTWEVPKWEPTPDFVITFSGSTGTYNTSNGRVTFIGLSNTSSALITVRVEFSNMTWQFKLGELVSEEWKSIEMQKSGNISKTQVQINEGESRKFSIVRYGIDGKLHSVLSYFILESWEGKAVVLRPWVGG
jgi:hypothetical protein